MTVVDNDETVIPRMLESHASLEDYQAFLMKLDFKNSQAASIYAQIDHQVASLTCAQTPNPLDTYMEQRVKSPNSTSISFYFQQAFYLNDLIIERLLDQLDETLREISNNNNTKSKQHEFNLTLSRTDEPTFNLTFRIDPNNGDDLVYAQRLVELSKSFVRPFMAEHASELTRVSENYRRVFALVSEGDNQFTSGKSIHTTEHTRNICVHSLCSRRDRLVRQSVGHLSHFRRFFVFRKFFVFNVKQLVFDFNYFNCFVKPVLNKY